jgi:hypothetical protein
MKNLFDDPIFNVTAGLVTIIVVCTLALAWTGGL